MSNTIPIPPAALEAGAIALAQEHGWPVETFDKLEPELRDDLLRPYIKRARAAFVAMVEAWPGMFETPATFCMTLDDYRDCILLPLTEKQDDKD